MSKFPLLTLAAAAALAFVPATHATPTGTLRAVYAGHTTATTDSSLTANPADLTNPVFQVPAEKHYFDVYLDFTSGTGEDFRAAIFNITASGGIVPVTKAGVSGGTSNKWFSNNPNSSDAGGNTFSLNGDGATGGDLLGITIQQTDPGFALATQAGEPGAEPAGIGYNATIKGSRLGRFAVQFAQPLTASATFTLAPQPGGGNFSWFSGNTAGAGAVVTPSSDPTGLTGQVVTIAVPEPTTLGLAAAAAIGTLLRRRRR